MSMRVENIKTIGVIGAGTMGVRIAAHYTNAGYKVKLFDILPRDGNPDRDAVAKNAVAKMLKDRLQPFMDPENANLIEFRNVEDHFHELGECDLITEAIPERADLKQNFYAKLEKVAKPTAIINSNSSGIPLDVMLAKTEGKIKIQLGHWCNPPRHVPLWETMASSGMPEDMVKAGENFHREVLGRKVVQCRRRPGFIANGLGAPVWEKIFEEAMEVGLDVETADALMSKVFTPKTGGIRLMGLIGLDIARDLSLEIANGLNDLNEENTYGAIYKKHPFLNQMIEAGYKGQKEGSKGGFYRYKLPNGTKCKQVLDISKMADGGDFDERYYRDVRSPEKLQSLANARHGPLAVLETDDKGGRFALTVVLDMVQQVAENAPKTAYDIVAVDDTFKAGFNWPKGPFELIDDEFGLEFIIKKMNERGMEVPVLLEQAQGKKFYRVENGQGQYLTFDGEYKDIEAVPGELSLDDVKRKGEPLLSNRSASLHNLGNGVACLEFHSDGETGMNPIDPLMIKMINDSVLHVNKDPNLKAMVIYGGKGKSFSAGANLKLMQDFAAKDKPALDEMLFQGQHGVTLVEYAPFPIVVATDGYVLGGGREKTMAADKMVVTAETKPKLVELKAGVNPGFLGVFQTLKAKFNQHADKDVAVRAAYEQLVDGTIPHSAQTAKKYDRLPKDAIVVMNPDLLLAKASEVALGMVDGYTPPNPDNDILELPSPAIYQQLAQEAKSDLDNDKISPHDYVARMRLLDTLSCGSMNGSMGYDGITATREDFAYYERWNLVALMGTEGAAAAIDEVANRGRKNLKGPKNLVEATKNFDENVLSAVEKRELTGKPVEHDDSPERKAMDYLASVTKKFLTPTFS